ncbi:MAG: L,D-transpeptidase family protein [Fusobacteriaceae bacterium]
MLKIKLLFLAVLASTTISAHENIVSPKADSEKSVGQTPAKKQSANYIIDEYTKVPLMATDDNMIPEEITFMDKFLGEEPELLDYVFVRTLKANVRALPGTNSPVLEEIDFNKKVRIYSKVMNMGTFWYEVRTSKGERGYVSAQLVAFRTFRFDEALKRITKVENFIEESRREGISLAVVNSYAPNPNSENMDRKKGKYGNTADQNTRALTDKGEEVFISDRSIMKILEREGNTARVKVESIPEVLTINTKNLSPQKKLDNQKIEKAVVIDTENQNMIIFEKKDGEWVMISYVQSKTGLDSQLGFETPKGSFLAAVSKFEMLYNNEVSEKMGYAKYATRFSGGGYLHGTPVNYEELINKEYFLSMKEENLGTLSGTRKCVRTSEDHARFVFDWITNGQYNRNSNDQHIKDNVLFVIL